MCYILEVVNLMVQLLSLRILFNLYLYFYNISFDMLIIAVRSLSINFHKSQFIPIFTYVMKIIIKIWLDITMFYCCIFLNMPKNLFILYM